MKKTSVILTGLLLTVSLIFASSCGSPVSYEKGNSIQTIEGMETIPAMSGVSTDESENNDLTTADMMTSATEDKTGGMSPYHSVSASGATVSEKYPSSDCYGPYLFGTESYSLYVGDGRIVLFDSESGNEKVNIEAPEPENIDLFLISASLIDLNFDEYADFSYMYDDSGLRNCYLAEKDELGNIIYKFDEALSSLYTLSRCYETKNIYGKTLADDEKFVVYQYLYCTEVDGETVPLETQVAQEPGQEKILTPVYEINEAFEWNLSTISSAFAGDGLEIYEPQDVLIRQRNCHSITISDYLTIAYDDYGFYYIKDMLGSGYCRLTLNPDGRWSKSEKVGN